MRLVLIVALLSIIMLVPATIAVRATGTACITSKPVSITYTVTLCITEPADGATVSGSQTVSATYTTTGANPGVAKLIYYLDGQYLLTDYAMPYTFALATNRWVDGVYSLAVEALMKDGFTSQRASITLTFNNGITQPPVNTNTFTPTSGSMPSAGQPFVLAAAGDGADGANYAGTVTNLIASWNPNLFLYLGDVYEKGTSTEFSNWYGGANTFYGRFRSITNPVVGNHEYLTGGAAGYFDYWNNIPSYYSYDAASWHFVALNSNCGVQRNCTVGRDQYQWLANDLNAYTNTCTIAYFHHPRYNIGPAGEATGMDDIWRLLAEHGVDIVLTGHDHDYQRWMPLDGSGAASPTGMTQFIVGSGGHGIQGFIRTDSRLAIGFDTSPNSFGALRLELNQDGAGYQFINYQGNVLDSGAIPCNGAPADMTVPTRPSKLTATAISSTQVNLSWNASTDNVGVVGYDIYRDGSLLTSIGVATSYSDTSVAEGATYNYQVMARDAAGHASAFSNTATVSLPALLFSDDFESGSLMAWTSVTNLTVQQQERYAGAFAARATLNNSTAQTYASKTLRVAQNDVYFATTFKIISQGSNVYLQRFRTNGNGAILGVFVSGTGRLMYRNDMTSSNSATGPLVSGGGWHQLQTHVHIDPNNSAHGQIEVWLDGALVTALSTTESLGTAPIGIAQLGDTSTSPRTYDVALDEVRVDTNFIDTSDTQAPSVPTGMTATASAPNIINLTWSAATDNINVIGYDLYRNGALLATLGATTSYTDTPVTPAFTYQYQVKARDAAGNVSTLSTAATITTLADTTAPSVTLTAPASGAIVSGSVTLSADASDDVMVDHVDFLVNGVVVGTPSSVPYRITWDSTTVANGAAVITVQAVDRSANATISAESKVTIANAGFDTTPPNVPTNLSASAISSGQIDLSWTAATDDIGVSGYDIYRDGAPLTAVGAVTNYSDTTAGPSTTYQYQIRARDAAGNVSVLSMPATATTSEVLFSDRFETGDLWRWTSVSGLMVQQQEVYAGVYAARATSTGPVSNALKQFDAAHYDLYYSTWFKILSYDSTNSVFLQRFRKADTQSALGVFVSSNGNLGYHNDISGVSNASEPRVSLNVWHEIQTHVFVNSSGGLGLVEVWFDGVRVAALSKAEALGNAPIAHIQLGDSTTGHSYDIAFDNVIVDTKFIALSEVGLPSIQIATPAADARVRGIVTLAADASDDVAVDRVEFLIDGSIVGTDYLSPYNTVWNSTTRSDGAVTLSARVIDTSTNVTFSPSRTVIVDNTAPNAIIDSGPAGDISGSAVSFTFSANEPDATFECALDAGDFVDCVSPLSYSGMAAGTHIFEVVAIDAAGNIDLTPATRNWTVRDGKRILWLPIVLR